MVLPIYRKVVVEDLIYFVGLEDHREVYYLSDIKQYWKAPCYTHLVAGPTSIRITTGKVKKVSATLSIKGLTGKSFLGRLAVIFARLSKRTTFHAYRVRDHSSEKGYLCKRGTGGRFRYYAYDYVLRSRTPVYIGTSSNPKDGHLIEQCKGYTSDRDYKHYRNSLMSVNELIIAYTRLEEK